MLYEKKYVGNVVSDADGMKNIIICGSYRAIKLLEHPMKVLEIVLERSIRCQLTCSLVSCLARELLISFSSCDTYKRIVTIFI